MLKAMGSEVRTGKYYNKAGKVALNIKGKSNYHFDYSKGGKSGHAEHSKYGKMTSGLTHHSEFQKQAKSSKGKVVKIHAGTHAEKRRDKKGKIVTRYVSNKPKVKGKKQAAGSVVNKPKSAGNPKARYFDGATGKEITKKEHGAMVAKIEASKKAESKTPKSSKEYLAKLDAEMAAYKQADIDANGGYEVESYGYNIDPKKPSAMAGLKKFSRLYEHSLHPSVKIKHIHEHYEPSELKKLGEEYKVPYPKTQAEHEEYLDGAGVYVMNKRGGKPRSAFENAISGAESHTSGRHGRSTTHYDHGPNVGKPLPKEWTDKMKAGGGEKKHHSNEAINNAIDNALASILADALTTEYLSLKKPVIKGMTRDLTTDYAKPDRPKKAKKIRLKPNTSGVPLEFQGN